MAIDHKQRQQVIEFGPETDLDELLDRADRAPVTIERDGVRYQIARDPGDVWAYHDPVRAREALEDLRGTLAGSGIDAEEWKREIRWMRGHDDDPPAGIRSTRGYDDDPAG